MNMELGNSYNPTGTVQIGFAEYVRRRKLIEDAKLAGNGLPNYAYAMDYELRKKLDAIPYLYNLGKKICGTVESRTIKQYNISSMKVGPNQFPDLYQIGCDNAKRLGIGIPNMFVVNDQSMNAFTMATDDVEPIIVIHSGLYERMTPGEMRFILGHECGHIHNQHGVYDMLASLLLAAGTASLLPLIPQDLLNLLTLGSQLAIKTWSRAAEVTCDRAGLICSERVEDGYTAMAKIMYGGAFGEHKVDFASIRAQLETQMDNISKYDELLDGHPSGARRIAAEMEFAECELLYQWRPELKQPGTIMRTKEETDERCRRVVDLTKKG